MAISYIILHNLTSSPPGKGNEFHSSLLLTHLQLVIKQFLTEMRFLTMLTGNLKGNRQEAFLMRQSLWTVIWCYYLTYE